MDWIFTLKKLLSIYLNPVSIVLELVFTGIVLIGIASRRPRKPLGPWRARLRAFTGDLGFLLVACGLLLLFVSSIDPVAHALTLGLEAKHPPLEEKDGVPQVPVTPRHIVVLGGGHFSVPGKPTLSRLSRHALGRMVGAVDLWKHFPEARFIVTGHPDETAAMRAVAERLGVSPGLIVEENESRDTDDHPSKLAPLVGADPFLLVTSGVHMPRAAEEFRGRGLDPILAPVDLTIWPRQGEYDPYRSGLFLPRPENILLTSTAVHEWCGILWMRWLGGLSGQKEGAGGTATPDPGRDPDSGTPQDEVSSQPSTSDETL